MININCRELERSVIHQSLRYWIFTVFLTNCKLNPSMNRTLKVFVSSFCKGTRAGLKVHLKPSLEPFKELSLLWQFHKRGMTLGANISKNTPSRTGFYQHYICKRLAQVKCRDEDLFVLTGSWSWMPLYDYNSSNKGINKVIGEHLEMWREPLIEMILARTRAMRHLRPKHKTITQWNTFCCINFHSFEPVVSIYFFFHTLCLYIHKICVSFGIFLKSPQMDYWTVFFLVANVDIFQVYIMYS